MYVTIDQGSKVEAKKERLKNETSDMNAKQNICVYVCLFFPPLPIIRNHRRCIFSNSRRRTPARYAVRLLMVLLSRAANFCSEATAKASGRS